MKTLFTALALLFALPVSAQLPPVFPEQMSDTLEHDTRMRTYLPPVRIVWTQNGEFVQTPEVLLAKGKGQMINAPYPHCILTNKDGKRPSILLDFGREIHGGVQIVVGDISNRKPVQFRMRLGESVSEAMSDISVESGATNDHAMRDLIVSVPWYGVSEVGNSGFRFVRLDLLTEDVVVKLQEVRAIFVYRDLPYLGSFHSSNPRLDSIWMTGAYTVHLNMQNYLWDGIKRDRLVWMGDAHPELRTILSVFGDNEVLRKTFDQARDQTPLPGWMNGICAYSLWWILIHRDYYNYTGDRAYLTEQQQYLEGLLLQVIESVDEQGREHLQGGGRFLDWPTSKNKPAVNAGLQALVVMSLEAGEQLMQVLNNDSLASRCQVTVERMRQAIPDYKQSKQSAALAALAGLATPEQSNEVLSDGGVQRYSTFYGYYMLQAKAMAGDYAGAMDDICRYWGGMLDLGATTFWEDFDIAWLENAARIDELVPAGKVDVHRTYGDYCYKGLRHSFCHGWASGPTAWLTEHVLGVTIVEPGCRVIRIDPHLGDLEWVEGSVPTPFGVVKIRHERRADGTISSKIDAPKGVKIVK